jgi:prevent-host-death family protein
MIQSNIHEAKSNLSRLIELAAAGEEVIIAKAGKPVARLVPYTEKKKPRRLGLLKGQIEIGPDFDAPLPESIMRAFRGESE